MTAVSDDGPLYADQALLSGEDAAALGEPAVVILHQLTLSADKIKFLGSLGYKAVVAGTAQKVLRLAREMGASYVVVSLGSGSNAPERIAAELHELEKPPQLLCCVAQDSARHRTRAATLGVDEIYVWPEGVFGRLVEAAPFVPTLSVRSAERLVLEQAFWGGDPQADGGRLMNISATGALVYLRHYTEDEYLSIGFKLPRNQSHMWLMGKVVRRERRGAGMQVALRFVRISPQQQRRIRDFVRSCNVIEVGSAQQHVGPKLKARVQARGKKRVDYFSLEEVTVVGAVLVPRVNFTPPFEAGMEVDLSVVRPGLGKQIGCVLETCEVRTEGRIDTLTCWRVRFESSEDGVVLVSAIEKLRSGPNKKPAKGRRRSHGS